MEEKLGRHDYILVETTIPYQPFNRQQVSLFTYQNFIVPFQISVSPLEYRNQMVEYTYSKQLL